MEEGFDVGGGGGGGVIWLIPLKGVRMAPCSLCMVVSKLATPLLFIALSHGSGKYVIVNLSALCTNSDLEIIVYPPL